jgi:hypothetical protein
MQTLLLLIALGTSFLARTVAAQDSATPVSDAVRSAAKRAATNFIAAAEEMPADKYGIGGVAPPKRSAAGAGAQKEKLVARLRETFQFCESALAKVNDSRLGEKVSYFGDDASRAQVMVAAAEEWAGHYSQIAVYLRLNGLIPPTARR